MATTIEELKARLNHLISPERTRATLKPVEPEFPADEVGAMDAVGYVSEEHDVRVSIYFYDSWANHYDVGEMLKAKFDDDAGVYAAAASNGPMLFFGHVRTDGDRGVYAEESLDFIMGAFAGDE